AQHAEEFCADIRKELLKQEVVSWDDTVIMVNTQRACLRFYGTEKLALYKAHMHKNKEGLDKDNILKLLPPTATVVHDHNKVNYNKSEERRVGKECTSRRSPEHHRHKYESST